MSETINGLDYNEQAIPLDELPKSVGEFTGELIDMNGNGVLESKNTNTNINATDVASHIDAQMPVSE